MASALCYNATYSYKHERERIITAVDCIIAQWRSNCQDSQFVTETL